MSRFFGAGLVATLIVAAAAFAGCAPPPVGDPCEPESVPNGGFLAGEAYIETSSVQCETRVCMVYGLAGDTREKCQDPVNRPPECGNSVLPEELLNRVYCTCRCDAPAGSNTKTCECPDGFECRPVLNLGGPGIQGSYCVRRNTMPLNSMVGG